MEKLLLPHRFKKVGWILFIPALILGLVLMFNGFAGLGWEIKTLTFSNHIDEPFNLSFQKVDITNTLAGTLLIVSCLLIGFSKEKNEDEYIQSLRLSSLLWAVIVNYTVLLIAFLFFFDFAFLYVMIYNMFTVLLLFVFRFNFLLFKSKSLLAYEK